MIKAAQMATFIPVRVENWEKEKMLATNIFSFYHNISKKASLPGFIKPGIVYNKVNSLPNDKILDWSKLKAIADDKINTTEKLKFVF